MAQAATGNVLLCFSSEIAHTRRSRSLFLTTHEPMVRYAADFARALGAARTARNARTAQAATGDVVLRYSSQVRFNCSAVSVVSLGRRSPLLGAKAGWINESGVLMHYTGVLHGGRATTGASPASSA